MATFYNLVIIVVFALTGCIESACTNGTSSGCKRDEICYQNQCYPNYGPCVKGACQQGLACVFDNCLNLLSTTASSMTTRNPRTITVICLDLSAAGRISDCSLVKFLCNNPIYYNLMTQQCPRTCNRCPNIDNPVETTIPACSDRVGIDNKTNCTSLAYLCRNLLYFILMKQQCPRTCGYC